MKSRFFDRELCSKVLKEALLLNDGVESSSKSVTDGTKNVREQNLLHNKQNMRFYGIVWYCIVFLWYCMVFLWSFMENIDLIGLESSFFAIIYPNSFGIVQGLN